MSKEILVVGSIAYDTIKTPFGSAKKALGGSATYFTAAATHFAPVRMVGVVGKDFKFSDYNFLKKRKADISGIEKRDGLTFHWKGEYAGDMNEAKTLTTCLNVFEFFNPQLSEQYKKTPYVFLGNIDPDLQLNVLSQVKKPKLIALDTMNLWIDIKLESLLKVISKVDILLLNNLEAITLTSSSNIVEAAKKLLKRGPKAVIIKKGEHGAYLRYGEKHFVVPAFPLEKVKDPTGAGDSFAGGLMGYLAKVDRLNYENLKKAMVYGSLTASFNVEDFSVKKLKTLTQAQYKSRYKSFLKMISI